MIGTFGAATRVRLPWETPPISGAPNQQPWGPPPTAPMPEEPADYGRAGGDITAQPKPKFFEQGGTGRAIAGAIGDYLARQAGGAPVYEQAMRAHMEQNQALLARQLEMNDWRAKEDYKTRHPSPFRFEANNGDQIEIGSDGQPRTLYKDPTPKTEWIKVTDPATGVISMVPRPMGGTPGMPTAPVGKLTPMGGAGQQAPRTFR